MRSNGKHSFTSVGGAQTHGERLALCESASCHAAHMPSHVGWRSNKNTRQRKHTAYSGASGSIPVSLSRGGNRRLGVARPYKDGLGRFLGASKQPRSAARIRVLLIEKLRDTSP